MSFPFVHLHVHSEYSLIDGIVRVKPLAKRVAELGMPAVAVTDQSNLFSMVKFYRAAAASGVKPLVGVDAWVEHREENRSPVRMVLLCKDHAGYLNLTHLVSESYIRGQRSGVPVIQRSWLREHAGGLIALSGAAQGDVGQAILAGQGAVADELAQEWRELFPDRYYLEIQRTGRPGDETSLHGSMELAARHDIPVVATNDVVFLNPDEFEAHEARVCIQEGRVLNDPHRQRRYAEYQYLRTPEEMVELFSDIPEALENSVEIAKRCNLELELGNNYLPEFPIPEGKTTDEYFREQAHSGLESRLKAIFDCGSVEFDQQAAPYRERLELELDVIIGMGFPGYFLIVADFIQWAKQADIPVGPGRGSGAGSLVAYALTITDLDPIRYELLFERFLNPERVSMPDFDIDFCMEGRDRVIEYVAERYGREKVSQIITYGSMAAKAVVRDVGRVLGHPYGFVDRIAKLIPFEIGMTLDKALEQEPSLKEQYDEEEDVRAVIDLARSLEGLARNAGKHAGGVVIAPSRLTDFTPLYCEQGSTAIVSQFDKDDVEAVGLVKFDFLGLRTLTIIDWALQSVNASRRTRGEELVELERIPLDDPETFRLLKACATTAVFQLESHGMKDLIKRLQPDSFDDIVALVALFRPGPLQSGMVDDFIERKHGRAQVEYPHPELEPILANTYGVILYQEQVMQIAQVLAGYSLGAADLLRRAMGKKKPEEMAKQREIFQSGAAERGVDAKVATYIFDLMEKFAGYGFNKSHSAAYALLAYQTAWLKAHYPAEFMAAVLSADMDNTDKIVNLIDECRDMKLNVMPPDVNQSEYAFTVTPDGNIVYGLGAVKGVGQAAVEMLVEERSGNGPFDSMLDLCCRADLRKVNRRVFEALIRAGALSSLGICRAASMAVLGDALRISEKHSRDCDAGQSDLFGSGEGKKPDGLEIPDLPEWEEGELLELEYEALGLYLTGHPITRYEKELASMTTGRLADVLERGADYTSSRNGGNFARRDERKISIGGLVKGLRTRSGQRGGRMAFLTLDDNSARLEVRVFSDCFDRFRHLIAKNRILVIRGGLGQDEFSGGYRLTADEIMDIEQARESHANRVLVEVPSLKAGNGFMGSLADVLSPFRKGRCPVWIRYQGETARADIALDDSWRVHPTDELLHRLRELAGRESVEIEY